MVGPNEMLERLIIKSNMNTCLIIFYKNELSGLGVIILLGWSLKIYAKIQKRGVN